MPLSTASSFEGPLQVNNLYPIFLHADQQYLDKAAFENSMSYSLSHSSTYTVQSSGRWDIDLDMEITELNFRYKKIIKDAVEFDVDLPVLIIGGGFMDGFLETYHDTFGLPDYGRSERPRNEFLYVVRKDGELIIDGKSGIGLGDIRLALKKPLITSDGFALSIKGDIELPTGNAKKGYGNGSLDAGLSLLIDKKISDSIITCVNFGAVFPGDVRANKELDLKNFYCGGLGIEADAGDGLSFLMQLQGESSIYPRTDLLAVDRDSFLLIIGGRYTKAESNYDISLAEDINASGAPDFILNITYKVTL